MPDLNILREWIVSGFVQNITWMIIAILFVQFGQRAYEMWKYGGWKVHVHKNEKDIVDREISPGKVKEILAEPAEMSVFVKGVASPYGWINCDILTEGVRLGLFVRDDKKRRLLIDLDKNPSDEKKGEKKTAKRTPQKRRA